MNLSDFIKKEAEDVRNDPQLFSLYLEQFRLFFGYSPSCVSCSFKNDWKKFCTLAKNNVNFKKLETMKENTFKIKDIDKIYRFVTKSGSVKRTFGYNMTEEFAEMYLKSGTAEEKKAKRLEFIELPISLRPKTKTKITKKQ